MGHTEKMCDRNSPPSISDEANHRKNDQVGIVWPFIKLKKKFKIIIKDWNKKKHSSKNSLKWTTVTIVDNRVLLFEYFVERFLNADITKFLTEIKSLNVFSTTLKLLGNL